jgi:hypothetical protein
LKEQPLNIIKEEINLKEIKIREDQDQITIDKIIGISQLNGINNSSESNDLISLNGITFQQQNQ